MRDFPPLSAFRTVYPPPKKRRRKAFLPLLFLLGLCFVFYCGVIASPHLKITFVESIGSQWDAAINPQDAPRFEKMMAANNLPYQKKEALYGARIYFCVQPSDKHLIDYLYAQLEGRDYRGKASRRPD